MYFSHQCLSIDPKKKFPAPTSMPTNRPQTANSRIYERRYLETIKDRDLGFQI